MLGGGEERSADSEISCVAPHHHPRDPRSFIGVSVVDVIPADRHRTDRLAFEQGNQSEGHLGAGAPLDDRQPVALGAGVRSGAPGVPVP
jgi:hypothetical protein